MARKHDPRRVARWVVRARLVGAIFGLLGGLAYSVFVIGAAGNQVFNTNQTAAAILLAGGVLGAATMALALPRLTIEPYLWMMDAIDDAPASRLIGGTVGIVVALVISVLAATLLSAIPNGFGYVISVPLTCVLIYIGAQAGTRRFGLVSQVIGRDLPSMSPQDGQPIVIDTSVLIDGRIQDIAKTGFIQGRILIANFVMEELQTVADAADPVRRGRGRRGLDALEALQQGRDVVCEVVDGGLYATISEVDSKLLKLAKDRSASLLTNDFNLNRLAQAQGVRVLNLNALTNALKPVLVSGEEITLHIIRPGKELQQGVGYLEDGTMVVVEGARQHIDKNVVAKVASTLQNPQGRIVFASLQKVVE